MSERTLVLVKPDGVRRGLVGEVVARIERKGLTITRMELRTVPTDLAEQHYAEHAGKPFFSDLVAFVTSGPLVAMVVEGADAVRSVRALMGATDPLDATPGSIRGDFATAIGENIVHGSDAPDTGEREIKIFFPDA
ncbi:MAG TPA: nucleoside-diphosphate kinase [Egibacteraceae bacterium]|nr:nucleoside-diphosphate kinase [Actinomycetota bacterium]HWB70600.1 nucleoside-diphosphate kinase [Egibacteraceae bacterium]